MLPDTIVTWKWKGESGYSREMFDARSVNHLAAMVRRYFPEPHDFVCVTDDSRGIDPKLVEVVSPLWPRQEELAAARTAHGSYAPSCYRKLRAFDPDLAEFGSRFVVLDLDMVATAELAPLFDRDEDFVMVRDPSHVHQFNGSLLMMNAGARPQVYNDFDPATSPKESLAAGYFGSDQGWISYKLLGDRAAQKQEAMFTKEHGVYSYLRDRLGRFGPPADCRLISFHGLVKPWHQQAQAHSWVREHWGVA